MADAWTWSATHQDYYRYTNEHGDNTGLINKITAGRLTLSRKLGDSLGKTNTAARRSVKVCHSDQILALISYIAFSGTRRDSLVSSPTSPNTGPQHGQAPTNNFQGYSASSIVNQTYSTAPNYSSGDRAYAGNTSLPTPQGTEPQWPLDQGQPYAYQQDQYGQSQQGYFPTTSGQPSRKYFLSWRFPQNQLTSFEELQTNNSGSFPPQPESAIASAYQRIIVTISHTYSCRQPD